MKQRCTLVVLMLLICLSIFGQQPKIVSIQGQPQKASIQVPANQEESIKQLQVENEAMKAQLEKMEKEIELYRGDVRTKEANINEVLSHWLTIMGIMMAVIGIAIPMILNYRNEKSMEKMLEDVKKEANSAKQQATSVAAQVTVATEQANKAKEAFDQMQPQIKSVTEQVDSATAQALVATEQAKQAKQAVTEIEDLKKHVTTIEEKINKDAIAAEKAANEAKASQLFTKAYAEKDPSKAVEIYTQVIEINPDDAMAYNNRAFDLLTLGKLDRALNDVNVAIEKDSNDDCFYDTRGQIYMAMGRNEDALIDLNHALSINANYIEGLGSRSKCYRKLAEAEQDPAKKADLIAKAEADEKKAESLKKGDKV